MGGRLRNELVDADLEVHGTVPPKTTSNLPNLQNYHQSAPTERWSTPRPPPSRSTSWRSARLPAPS